MSAHDYGKELYFGDNEWKKLRGQHIPVELTVEQIQVILYALDDFQLAPLITTLSETMSNLSTTTRAAVYRNRIQDDVEKVFKEMFSQDEFLELLRNRLNEAVHDTLENQKNQGNLPL